MKAAEVKKWLQRIEEAESEAELEDVRRQLLGRKGELTTQLRQISQLKEDERAEAGKRLNDYKQQIEKALQERRQALLSQTLEEETQTQVDLTRPGIGPDLGSLHPVLSLQHELIRIFTQLGFVVASGPEVETDWYNFEALNMGSNHPARDMQDTFYLDNGFIPRTHTSSVQIRYMEANPPPVRIIAPGKVYRNEDEDATHIWSFHQLECLVVDRGVRLSDLKGTLEYMLRSLFGEAALLRLRPDYFPYTEPSLEVDASCLLCGEDSAACRVCKGTGWVELGGAGMVHPNVLRNVGLDPKEYSGFAFGFGLERMVAVQYQLPDLRDLWRPDLKFLEQF